MSNRIEYIDIARGIGILLVVLGHNDFAFISPFLYQVIYSFHMPLFFFLSGFFLNPFLPFLEFFKKRFNSLLKPYWFTIFLIYFASISFEKMSFQTALGRIVKSLYASGDYIDWTVLWFLPHLFVVSLYAFFFYQLFTRLNSRFLKWTVLIATLWLTSLFLKTFYPFPVAVFGKEYMLFGLPFSLDLIFLSGFFYMLGYEFHQANADYIIEKPIIFFVAGLGMFALNFFFSQRIDFNTRTYESFFVNTAEAILGILFVLALSHQIALRVPRLAALFTYLGQISIIILIFHIPIQDFWGQKILAVTNNPALSIWGGFIMGVTGSILIYELFIKANPVASWWFGRQAELPEQKTIPAGN